ncbi:MAG: hypothetical protein FJX77_00670 [Armatimonadetes bacterium]|nr:hypothetical protein [Armatimonadota bacterium]
MDLFIEARCFERLQEEMGIPALSDDDAEDTDELGLTLPSTPLDAPFPGPSPERSAPTPPPAETPRVRATRGSTTRRVRVMAAESLSPNSG